MLKSTIQNSILHKVIFPLMATILLFLIGWYFLARWIPSVYTLDNQAERRLSHYAIDFQRFVLDERIRSTDDYRITVWADQRNYLVLAPSSSYDIVSQPHATFTIDFFDQSQSVRFLYLTNMVYRDKAAIGAAALVLGLWILVTLFSLKKQQQSLDQIKSQLTSLTEGRLESIDFSCSDKKLSPLIDETRKLHAQLVNHQATTLQYQKMMDDIMGSVSHDFKTPLTAIVGYLELMKTTSPQVSMYAATALTKTDYLLHLIDDALYYYNASARLDQKEHVTKVNGVDVFRHFSAYVSSALPDHYRIQERLTDDPAEIWMDDFMMTRLFDNLLSNLMKHADPSYPIKQINYIDHGWLVFEQRNHRCPSAEKNKSTGLGLKTCHRIMTAHKGVFESHLIGSLYTTTLKFPLHHETFELTP
ncbi:sensor histidine kinase [Tindallia californiensis]|nr:HAMP domain-containing sensor histidine kinase [Tindallia californiensis]